MNPTITVQPRDTGTLSDITKGMGGPMLAAGVGAGIGGFIINEEGSFIGAAIGAALGVLFGNIVFNKPANTST